MTFCEEKYAILFSFNLNLNLQQGYEKKFLEITHFVNLLCLKLSELNIGQDVKSELIKNRKKIEAKLMEEQMKEELEQKEREEFKQIWLKSKNKGKKKNKYD